VGRRLRVYFHCFFLQLNVVCPMDLHRKQVILSSVKNILLRNVFVVEEHLTAETQYVFVTFYIYASFEVVNLRYGNYANIF
jgi:hypothetical protein